MYAVRSYLSKAKVHKLRAPSRYGTYLYKECA